MWTPVVLATGRTGLAAVEVGMQLLARDGAAAADVLRRQLPLITRALVPVTVTMGETT